MKRALLIKMSSLGDVVHAMPAVSDAAAAGWQAHLWTGAGDARQVLRDAGVL